MGVRVRYPAARMETSRWGNAPSQIFPPQRLPTPGPQAAARRTAIR